MTTEQDLERVARDIYGPALRGLALASVEAIALLRIRLDAFDRERSVLNEALAQVERRVRDIMSQMGAA